MEGRKFLLRTGYLMEYYLFAILVVVYGFICIPIKHLYYTNDNVVLVYASYIGHVLVKSS